jgi:ubiquinol oxidase
MSKYSKPEQDLNVHIKPTTFSDKFAYLIVKVLRFGADLFFKNNYAKRSVMLETVAGVPGMVAGCLQHLSILRNMKADRADWIKKLLDEAENERMHLMAFLEIAKPSRFDRIIIFFVQGIFFNSFFLLYTLSPKIAHRIVGYFEEEAVISYTRYLDKIDKGEIENIKAPEMAFEYWDLPNGTLRDLVIAIRNDEAEHRDVNHDFSSLLEAKKELNA